MVTLDVRRLILLGQASSDWLPLLEAWFVTPKLVFAHFTAIWHVDADRYNAQCFTLSRNNQTFFDIVSCLGIACAWHGHKFLWD